MSDLEKLLADLGEQDNELEFTQFGRKDGWEIGSRLTTTGQERALPIAIKVTLGPQTVYHAGLDGSSADNDHWLARKIETVRRFDTSSLMVATRMALHGVDLDALGIDLGRHAISGGAVPIRIKRTQVGVLAVSGLTDLADHQLAIEALRSYREACS